MLQKISLGIVDSGQILKQNIKILQYSKFPEKIPTETKWNSPSQARVCEKSGMRAARSTCNVVKRDNFSHKLMFFSQKCKLTINVEVKSYTKHAPW